MVTPGSQNPEGSITSPGLDVTRVLAEDSATEESHIVNVSTSRWNVTDTTQAGAHGAPAGRDDNGQSFAVLWNNQYAVLSDEY